MLDVRRPVTTILFCCVALASLTLPTPATAGDTTAGKVIIYRCTDAKGRLALRDTPCRKGETQETRSMVRPKDGTPPAPIATPVRRPAQPAPPAPMRVVVVSAPQPLYQCTTPDGDSYTSDSSEGRPRWVPLWTLGYPGYPQQGWRHGSTSGGSSSIDINNGSVRIHADSGNFASDGYVPPGYGYGAAGTWIRDTCHALPQREVCARLVDQRDEIRRRFFNAQQTERDRLRVQERGINARLDNDCDGH